jgi:hypothetical protein
MFTPIYKLMFGLILLIVMISILYLGLHKLNNGINGNNKNRGNNGNNSIQGNKDKIDTLVRQSSRYAMAAEQDLSPLIAMLHANYAAGYLWAMKDIYNENQINLVIGKDNLKMLEKYVKKVQDISTKRMTKACPQFVGELSNINIARLAGNI